MKSNREPSASARAEWKRSHKKFAESVGPMTFDQREKVWVYIRFLNGGAGGWVPSFADLYRIVTAIADCEEEKYPSSNGQRGKWMVVEFIKNAIAGRDYDWLADHFDIPERST